MKKLWSCVIAALMTMAVMVMGGCGGGSSGDSNSGGGGGTTSYSIAGVVTVNGTGLSGVTVAISGSSSATTTTDSSGNYSFGSIQNGSYSVTSVLSGYTFAPATLAVTVSGANLTGKSFTATTAAAGTYNISGTITSGGSVLAGATVTLSGSGSTTATTDSSGNYTFIGAQSGSYTLTPLKSGYTFSPLTLAVTVNGTNVAGQNFTAAATAANSYSISGTITSGGAALSGVTLSTTSGSANSDSTGNFIISGFADGNYTLTPSKTGYTFTPATLAVIVSGANLTGKNFTATASSSGTTGTVQLPKTGQTTSYASGDDGALQKGVVWPNLRFTDNSNGTVTDNLTGLIWLRNANCFGKQAWTVALASANTLANGACGLTDSSSAGQWRLPNVSELESLVDLSQYNPALPIGHKFTSLPTISDSSYWSSSTVQAGIYYTPYAYIIGLIGGAYGGSKGGDVDIDNKTNVYYVWPVRSGQ